MAHAGASINAAPLVVSSDEAAFVFDAEAVDVVSLVTRIQQPELMPILMLHLLLIKRTLPPGC